MINELKAFLLRGNVVDLAVAVVIGAAFLAIVNAFVEHIITPLIGVIVGGRSVAEMSFEVNGVVFGTGYLLDAIINFILVGIVLFFVVKGANKAMEARRTGEPEDVTVPDTPEDIELLRQIRDSLALRA